jgi:hypothetical protein
VGVMPVTLAKVSCETFARIGKAGDHSRSFCLLSSRGRIAVDGCPWSSNIGQLSICERLAPTRKAVYIEQVGVEKLHIKVGTIAMISKR